MKEVWFTICEENEIFQDFLNTSESSNDNTNVVSASQEPFVFNQDPGENSLQTPPHIDHYCCYGCGDSLDSIFCQRCTCEFYGNDTHIGYNCPLKVSIISNPEPFPNQNVDEFPQTLPSFHPTCYSGDENSFAYDSTPNFVGDSPNVFNPRRILMSFVGTMLIIVVIVHLKFRLSIIRNRVTIKTLIYHKIFKVSNNNILVVKAVGARMRPFNVLLLAWDRVFEIKDAFGNKQYKPEDVQNLIRKLFIDVKKTHQELAEYINTLSWNRPAFYTYDDDDDEDYTIAITPVLSTEEPVDSLIMKDEHLDTILAMESDEVTSVEDLVPIPSESEGVPDNMCGASPPDSELVSLEEVKDDILREKLLNIHLLIDKIESFNDNPTPDRVLKSPSLFHIPVEDSDSFFKKSDTSLSYSDNSLPEFETFSDHPEETSCGSTTTHADYSLPKYDSFLFEIEPDQGELTNVIMEDNLGELRVHVPNNSGSTAIHADIPLPVFDNFHFKIEPDPGVLTSIVDSRIRENVPSATNVNLSPEDDQSPLFAYVVWILLPFLTYLVAPSYLLSSGNEDTIFDPGISIYHSFLLGVSPRSRTFMKINVYTNHLSESSMEILSSTCFPMDQ
nr:hypothetical protein [Tanacetum cinerariifolium]